MLQSDITTPADVIFLYLMPKGIRALGPKLKLEVKPTARVVSLDYPMQGVKPAYCEAFRYDREPHFVYVHHEKGLLEARPYQANNPRVSSS